MLAAIQTYRQRDNCAKSHEKHFAVFDLTITRQMANDNLHAIVWIYSSIACRRFIACQLSLALIICSTTEMLSSLRNTVEEPDHVYHSISSRPPFELGDWLASLSLLQYQNNFQDCGIETMNRLHSMLAAPVLGWTCAFGLLPNM